MEASPSGDLSVDLQSILERYGFDFDIATEAVAPGNGEILPKHAIRIRDHSISSRSQLLVVDPLTDRNVTDGVKVGCLDKILETFRDSWSNGTALRNLILRGRRCRNRQLKY